MSLNERFSKYLEIIAAKTNQELIGHFQQNANILRKSEYNALRCGEQEPGRRQIHAKMH